MTHTGENVSGIALDLHAPPGHTPAGGARARDPQILIYGQASGTPRETDSASPWTPK